MNTAKTSTKHTNTDEHEVLDDADLDSVQGGVALLLPAVQSVREAARRESAILDFALTGDDSFSKTKGLKSRA